MHVLFHQGLLEVGIDLISTEGLRRTGRRKTLQLPYDGLVGIDLISTEGLRLLGSAPNSSMCWSVGIDLISTEGLRLLSLAITGATVNAAMSELT